MLCECHACIVPVGSDVYNIYSVCSLMEEKGWNLATGQEPPYLAICIGERHGGLLELLEHDLRASVSYLEAHPDYRPQGAAKVYGAMASTPSAILEEVVRRYVDLRLEVKPKKDTESDKKE